MPNDTPKIPPIPPPEEGGKNNKKEWWKKLAEKCIEEGLTYKEAQEVFNDFFDFFWHKKN